MNFKIVIVTFLIIMSFTGCGVKLPPKPSADSIIPSYQGNFLVQAIEENTDQKDSKKE